MNHASCLICLSLLVTAFLAYAGGVFAPPRRDPFGEGGFLWKLLKFPNVTTLILKNQKSVNFFSAAPPLEPLENSELGSCNLYVQLSIKMVCLCCMARKKERFNYEKERQRRENNKN